MAIQYKHGEEEVKALAQKAGEAQAAKQELDRRFQKDMAMMDYQFRLQLEARRRAWDLEKMEIASRNDFDLAERKRVEMMDRFNVVKEAIEGDTRLTPDEKSQLVLQNQLKIFGGVAPESISPYQQELLQLRREEIEARRDPIKELMKQRLAEQGAGGPTASPDQPAAPAQPVAPQPQQGAVLGQAALQSFVPVQSVPPVDIPQDEEGNFIVADPKSGEMFAVTPRELPEFMQKGFVTKPLSGGLWNALFSNVDAPTTLNLSNEPLPGIGFGGAGYVPRKPKVDTVYDPGERVRGGLRQVGRHLSR